MNSHGKTVSNAAETSRSKSLRVLCAEDEPSIADLLALVLRKGGHEVECVENGRAALQWISSDPNYFDLVLTDHEMPFLDGLELVRKLRRLAYAGRIIVHSSQLRDRDAAAYRALNVDHIFTKPVDPTELLKVVGRLAMFAP